MMQEDLLEKEGGVKRRFISTRGGGWTGQTEAKRYTFREAVLAGWAGK